MNDEITIRRAETIADYRTCQDAQRRAWGLADEGYVVPIATMVGAQLHGGVVLGAFLPDGTAVGLSFAFLGRVEGRLCLYSQLTGVVPGYQAHGLGGRLKHAQRELARAAGLDLIAWAFDPLQAGNARFNLDKLGATAGRYIQDMYGPRTDSLNAGLPTDRLIAEWGTADRPRPDVVADEALRLPRVIATARGADGELTVVGVALPAGAPMVLLEIPEDINGLRMQDARRAEQWRLAVRQGFLAAFGAGYRAVGFLRHDSEGRRRCFYLLGWGEPSRM
jgi:predicted GNAT superfamily acetyltransferase